MSKVRLSQLLRDGGLGLSKAVELTDAVLEGCSVRVRLDQFKTVDEARDALDKVGIDDVSAAPSL